GPGREAAEHEIQQDGVFTAGVPVGAFPVGVGAGWRWNHGVVSVGAVQGQHALLRFDAPVPGGDLLEFGAAYRDIAVVAADLNLRTGGDGVAVRVHAHHHGGLVAGVADGLDFLQL